MTMVLLIWALQLGALVYLSLKDASLAAFVERLKHAILRPSVAMLAFGCIAFMYAGTTAAYRMDYSGTVVAFISFVLECLWLVGSILRALFARFGGGGIDLTFGSAQFADYAHALMNGLVGESGIRLGMLRSASVNNAPVPLHYTGERHLLTVAPTRAGKGVSTIIPNLLTYLASVLVIDPKGENAIATYERRSKIGRCFVIDPWNVTGLPVSRFNPLDLLRPDSHTLIEDATQIAEELVENETDGNAKHFSEQASDFIKGMLIYLTVTPGEVKTLGRLRAILTGSSASLTKLAVQMLKSSHPVVAAAAAQIASKNDKEWLSIVSTAQRNTHFLDSPALKANLGASDFRFADLKGDAPVSIYLVLPVDRLTTHNRWLRIIIALAIADLARTAKKPKRPVLFLLDEFASLGRMRIIEDAYGLMAGLGMQMHAIVQDLTQLERLYGQGWQTFVGNSGAIQVFGTRDWMTAEYFSKLVGVTTQTVRSTSEGGGSTSGQSPSSSRNWGVSYAPAQRPLLFPDELMRMDKDAQLVFVENANPCISDKIVWHSNPAYVALAGNGARAR